MQRGAVGVALKDIWTEPLIDSWTFRVHCRGNERRWLSERNYDPTRITYRYATCCTTGFIEEFLALLCEFWLVVEWIVNFCTFTYRLSSVLLRKLLRACRLLACLRSNAFLWWDFRVSAFGLRYRPTGLFSTYFSGNFGLLALVEISNRKGSERKRRRINSKWMHDDTSWCMIPS